MKRIFQLGERRLWSIERKHLTVTVRWGLVGGKEQAHGKKHHDEWGAMADLQRHVREKLEAGYRELTVHPQLPALDRTGQLLEAALTEDPTDLAGHMAYADWLSEQDDPVLQLRSEFVRVQLALEGRVRGAQNRKLTNRLTVLVEDHEHTWLGTELARMLTMETTAYLPHYMRRAVSLYHRQYRRGWLDELAIAHLTDEFARVLAAAPATRLLRSLVIEGVDTHGDAFATLGRAQYLGNVRSLLLTGYEGFPNPTALVASLPRLEELRIDESSNMTIGQMLTLPSLGQLRGLHLRGLSEYPVVDLANNAALRHLERVHLVFQAENQFTMTDLRHLTRSPHLPALTELRLYCCSLGDEMIREIIDAGLLLRLKTLDLTYGTITDEGVRCLANCPDLAYLDRLVLHQNRLSRLWLTALNNQCGTVEASRQQTPTPDGRYPEPFPYWG